MQCCFQKKNIIFTWYITKIHICFSIIKNTLYIYVCVCVHVSSRSDYLHISWDEEFLDDRVWLECNVKLFRLLMRLPHWTRFTRDGRWAISNKRSTFEKIRALIGYRSSLVAHRVQCRRSIRRVCITSVDKDIYVLLIISEIICCFTNKIQENYS